MTILNKKRDAESIWRTEHNVNRKMGVIGYDADDNPVHNPYIYDDDRVTEL
ncbi:MAG: hypothetical protein GWN17_13325, partial [Candidatus Korarchaeota archaeon]|nr:hypothetical protein [Candidatus Korarchaeota archaeon]